MTEKQKIFADEYLIDLNATRAYRVAYPNCKKDSSADASARKLLGNTRIKEYIDERMKELESERVADIQEVLEYLTAVMRREKRESVVVTISSEKSVYVKGEDGKLRKQTTKEEIPKIIEIPTKISDSNKAAELLGKRYALFTEKVEVDADMELNIIIDYGEDDSG